jgi:ABC-2 type transport system ATP-binding protein
MEGKTMNDYENAIEIKDLTKKYDGFTLDKVSFNVPKGSIMGFIGQNGAGKTTTINALLNIVKKDEGEIKLLGLDHQKDEYEIKKQTAAIFDELPFDDRLNAIAIDKILREIYEEWSSETFFNYLDRFALPRKKKFGKFSKGMKMKLQIASALSHNAKLLIMDEATTGLDPVVRNEILDIFLEYLQNEDHTILMSSHITSDLDKVADCVTFIDRGKVLISGYKDDILESHGILKCTKDDYKDIAPEDIVSARLSDFGAEVMVSDKAECSRKYSGAVIDPATLEDIMLYYVNRGKKEWR